MIFRARGRHAAPTKFTRAAAWVAAQAATRPATSAVRPIARPAGALRPAVTDRSTRGWLIAAGTMVAAGLALGLLPPVSASAAGAHDPFGHLDRAVPIGQTGIQALGWTADPDALSQPLTVTITVDGAVAGQVATALPRPDATAARGTGPAAGFSAGVPAVPGPHLVCASAGNLGLGGTGSLGCLSVLVPGLTPAQLQARSPYGMLDRASAAGTTVSLLGWAVDPDNLTQPLAITATVDSKAATLASAQTQSRPDVMQVHHTGPNQGYLLTTVVAANGLHTVCTTAANLAVGNATRLGCAVVRIGPPPLTPAQIAAHSPTGALEQAQAESTTSLRVSGWASDPDDRTRPLNVVGYLDGNSARTVLAGIARPDLLAAKLAGANAGFSFAVPTSAGAHNICVWAVNIGIGNNRFLGCAALSTPAAVLPSGPAPATPTANQKVVALAAKYLGSRYTWGGASPATGFDCSGLVQYTYRTGAGITTPRVAQDQFGAARMIAPGRAVPGDLVFFHDTMGAVYHVGIYAAPGLMYAAVDETHGVRYQQIWDSTATFGSFTHS